MNAGRLLLGLLLVAGGLTWLALSTGWLWPHWQAVYAVARFLLSWWPLLLVATGLGILLSRRTGFWLGLLALVGGAIVVLWIVSAIFAPWTWMGQPGRHVARVARPDGLAAGAAELEIDVPAASLALTGGVDGDALAVVESSLTGLTPRAVRRSDGGAAVLMDTALPLVGAVRLDDRQPWRVEMDAAAAQVRLDLKQVSLAGLQVDAASVRLSGSIGQVVDGARIVVDAAFADTHLDFPAGVGVEVRVRGTRGRLDLPGFVVAGSGWRSPNWEEARVRVVVEHRATAYRLAIRLRDPVTEVYSTTVTQPTMPSSAWGQTVQSSG
ncbi:MAG TPA: hypothetical protein VF282_06420 [Bacillota bacterium]